MLQDQPLISKSVPTLTPLYPRVRPPGHPCLQRTLASAAWQSDFTPLPSLGHKALRSCLGHPLRAWWPSGELEPRPLHTAGLLSCGGVVSHPAHGIRGLLEQTARHREAIRLPDIPAQTFSSFFPSVKGGHRKPHRGSGLTQAPGSYLF